MNSASLSPRIEQLRQQLQEGNVQALDVFWQEVADHGAPLIEAIPDEETHVLVTFLWKDAGDTRNVVVFGGPASRTKPLTNQLTRLLESNVWYKTYRARADLRIWYSLSHNDPLDFDLVEDWGKREAETFRADPLNPRRFVGYGEGASVLELPAAPPQPWIEPRPGVPGGQVVEQRISSQLLEGERRIWVYTPPFQYPHTGPERRVAPAAPLQGEDTPQIRRDQVQMPYGLLILLDGQLYLNNLSVTTTLDNLLSEGRIAPLVVVLVDNPGERRTQELNCSHVFTDFLVQEVLPWVQQHYHVTTDPAQTIIGGLSAGGLAAAFAAWRSPELFGAVLSQSGAFWLGPSWQGQEFRDTSDAEWLTQQFVRSPKLPLRFYIEAGLFEYSDNPFIALLMANRHLRDVLQAKGYDIHYTEFNGGHDPFCWRGSLADGLQVLAAESRNPLLRRRNGMALN